MTPIEAVAVILVGWLLFAALIAAVFVVVKRSDARKVEALERRDSAGYRRQCVSFSRHAKGEACPACQGEDRRRRRGDKG